MQADEKPAGIPGMSEKLRRTSLPRSGLEVSRLGLGLAHVHTMNKHQARRLIDEAISLGITHFDTSRFYGDGMSERILGQALRGRRQDFTIATKFGLLPTPVVNLFGPAAPLARKGRSLLRKLGIVQYPRGSYSVATMERALRASLRALGTDYIDIYAIHEPNGDEGLEDSLFEALRRARASGAIRLIAVSGDNVDAVVARWGSELDVVQTGEARWRSDGFVPDITYSLFSPAVRSAGGAASAATVQTLLEAALRRRAEGAFIVQTRSPGHLRELVQFAGNR